MSNEADGAFLMQYSVCLQLVSSVYSRVEVPERIWLNQSRHPMNEENRYKS
jgi:hypothetical protein